MLSLMKTTWKRLAEWGMRQFARVLARSAVPWNCRHVGTLSFDWMCQVLESVRGA
jgi:hypothetical protein